MYTCGCSCSCVHVHAKDRLISEFSLMDLQLCFLFSFFSLFVLFNKTESEAFLTGLE